MVIISTSAVLVSIQAVSPVSIGGGFASAANAVVANKTGRAASASRERASRAKGAVHFIVASSLEGEIMGVSCPRVG